MDFWHIFFPEEAQMISNDGRRDIQINNMLRELSPKAREVLAQKAERQRKKVVCLDTGRVFVSILAAATYFHMSPQALKYRIAKGLVNMRIEG